MIEPLKDEPLQMKTYSVHEISGPSTERELSNDVFIDGGALYGFLHNLDVIRTQQGAFEEKVQRVDDDDFQIMSTGGNITEVGALLTGQVIGGERIADTEIKVNGATMLRRSGVAGPSIEVSSFDIQEAKKSGSICGWIHSQPGDTKPSTGEEVSDLNVSRFLSQYADCPNHLVLTTDRNAGRITGYLYSGGQFELLRGLKIRIPSTMPQAQRTRIERLRYTDK